jgi:predicted ATPase
LLAIYDPNAHGQLVDQIGGHPQVNARVILGWYLFLLGFPDQALRESKAAIDEARRLAHAPSLGHGLGLAVGLQGISGIRMGLGETAEQLVALAAEHDFPYWRALGDIHRGWSMVIKGDLSQGLALLRAGCIAHRATVAEAWVPQNSPFCSASASQEPWPS